MIDTEVPTRDTRLETLDPGPSDRDTDVRPDSQVSGHETQDTGGGARLRGGALPRTGGRPGQDTPGPVWV